MFIHFASTDGTVFTPNVSAIPPQDLGTIICDDEFQNIVVVDRTPDDTITQLEMSVLIPTLTKILRPNAKIPNVIDATESDATDTLFTQQTMKSDPTQTQTLNHNNDNAFSITMYLPQMEYDMYGEAVVQREFYRNIPNIVIVPV